MRRTRFLNFGLPIRSPEHGRANLQEETPCNRTTYFGRVIVRRATRQRRRVWGATLGACGGPTIERTALRSSLARPAFKSCSKKAGHKRTIARTCGSENKAVVISVEEDLRVCLLFRAGPCAVGLAERIRARGRRCPAYGWCCAGRVPTRSAKT